MNFYAFSALVNLLTSFLLASFVLYKNVRSRLNIAFAIFAGCAFVWSFGYFFWQISENADTALFWSRILMAGAIFLPVTYYHLVLEVVQFTNKKRKFLRASYFLFLLFLIIDLTPYFINRVEKVSSFDFWPLPGFAFHIFLAIWFFYVIYSSYLLYTKYKITQGVKKEQVKYVLAGIVIGFIGGSTNYFLWYKIPIPPIANILASVYVGTTAYAIVRHRFMDIRVVLRKGFVHTVSLVILLSLYTYLTLFFQDYFELNRTYTTLIAVLVITLSIHPLRKWLFRGLDSLFFEPEKDKETLQRFSHEIAKGGEIEDLFKKVQEAFTKGINIKEIKIFILDKTQEKFLAEFPEDIKGRRSVSEESKLVKYLKENKKIVVKEELPYLIQGEEEREVRKLEEIEMELKKKKAEAVIPIGEESIFALIFLGSKKSKEAFTVQDVKFLNSFAKQFTFYLGGALLYKQAVERAIVENKHI